MSIKDRLSDRLSAGLATWTFLTGLTLGIIGSVLWNSILPQSVRYDPYPFILLNLFMSALAALTAPILLMAANRQAAKDREAVEEARDDSSEDLELDTKALDLIKRIAAKMEIT